ncbi:tryptophan 7-halogenase [Acetobacteraceae bacterium ESL0709]|nr:tryptophan 7-halogenase [Acetobacteraceae bacterium ESL0697]MDF7678946.1 tryptophan 7-halogenase [Acetobacteraceae bacterium ESL0709]
MIYDVAIIGAGLAGLTLARQLSLEIPSASVCLIHDKTFPNPLAAHKVGESTVELGAFYLRDTLGLNDYMHETHLSKMGLRFLQTCSDGENYKELGIYHFPYHDAFQIDRGLLENDLYNFVKPTTDIFEQHRFMDFDRIDEVYHIRTLHTDGTERVIKARWLVDASGRKRCLAKKLGFKTAFPLTHSAVWFRVDGVVDLNDIYVSDDPDNVFKGAQRSNSTVHLMGKGRWVWLIPLAGNKTSIGIVFDETVIDAGELLSQEKAFAWLKEHENKLYNELVSKKYPVLDFKYFRKYSYISDEFLSLDKWAVVGEAKAFVDPLYSNGTDFIAMENTMVCNTIAAEMGGYNIYDSYVNGYNELMGYVLKGFFVTHEDSYKYFDDWYYIYVKTNIDAIFYFSTVCVIFMNKKMESYDFLMETRSIILKMLEDHDRVMNYIKSEAFQRHGKVAKRFISIEGSIEAYVNRDIVCKERDDEAVLELLRDNAYIYKKLVDYIINEGDFEFIFYPPVEEALDLESAPLEAVDWRYGDFFPPRVEAVG